MSSVARKIQFNQLFVQTTGDRPELKGANFFPDRTLIIRPSLSREIGIKVEPICSYGDVTKVEVTLQHNGQTTFRDLTLSPEPANVIRSGKLPLRRAEFAPGTNESFTLAATDDLELVLRASVNGVPVIARRRVHLEALPTESVEPFHFLEPSRLAQDRIVLRPRSDRTHPLVAHDSAFPVTNAETYEVELYPEEKSVTNIEITGVPRSIQVRNVARDSETGAWRFEIDVSHADLFSKPESIGYRAQTGDETYFGQIHLRVQPASSRHFRFALTAGAAATAKGGIDIARTLANPERDLAEIVGETEGVSLFSWLLFISIPVVWIGMAVLDRVLYRFRS